MTALDLTDAVEAAARAYWHGEYPSGVAWDAVDPLTQHSVREAVLPVVTAAAEVIREHIAVSIDREVVRREVPCHPMRTFTGLPPAPPVHEDCVCEHDVIDDGDERLPRRLRITDPYCPVHGTGDPCPECGDGVVVLGHIEAGTGHQTAHCSDPLCGWSA